MRYLRSARAAMSRYPAEKQENLRLAQEAIGQPGPRDIQRVLA